MSPRGRTRASSPESEYSLKIMVPTARLTSWSSPVSATKSIQTSRPRRSVKLLPEVEAPSTLHTRSRRIASWSGCIQSRISRSLLAAAVATRWRRCPARADIPNQRMAKGECVPRWKRPILPVSCRGLSVTRSDSASPPAPGFTLVECLMGSSCPATLYFMENRFLHTTKIEAQP